MGKRYEHIISTLASRSVEFTRWLMALDDSNSIVRVPITILYAVRGWYSGIEWLVVSPPNSPYAAYVLEYRYVFMLSYLRIRGLHTIPCLHLCEHSMGQRITQRERWYQYHHLLPLFLLFSFLFLLPPPIPINMHRYCPVWYFSGTCIWLVKLWQLFSFLSHSLHSPFLSQGMSSRTGYDLVDCRYRSCPVFPFVPSPPRPRLHHAVPSVLYLTGAQNSPEQRRGKKRKERTGKELFATYMSWILVPTYMTTDQPTPWNLPYALCSASIHCNYHNWPRASSRIGFDRYPSTIQYLPCSASSAPRDASQPISFIFFPPKCKFIYDSFFHPFLPQKILDQHHLQQRTRKKREKQKKRKVQKTII